MDRSECVILKRPYQLPICQTHGRKCKSICEIEKRTDGGPEFCKHHGFFCFGELVEKPKKPPVPGVTHPCKICGKEFDTYVDKKNHIQSWHYFSKTIKCHLCDETFRWQELLDTHVLNHHVRKRKHACSMCPATYLQSQGLKAHMQAKHQIHDNDENKMDESEKFNSDSEEEEEEEEEEFFMDETFASDTSNTSKNDLKQEVEIEPEMKNVPEKIFCKPCKINFETWDQKKEHVLMVHSPIFDGLPFMEKLKSKHGENFNNNINKEKSIENNLACPICDEEFQNCQERKDHICQVKSKKEFACPLCEKSYQRKELLDKHVNSHLRMLVQNMTCYNCDICDKKFSQIRDLKRHRNAVHYSELLFKCDVCNEESFERKIDLNYHKSTVHEEGNKKFCRFCGKGFKSRSALKAHVALAHEKKKFVQCNFCPQTFSSKKEKKEHVKSGDCKKKKKKKEKLKVDKTCSTCGKKFGRRFDLDIHIKQVHENLRLFTCNLCSTSFKKKFDLNRHLKIHRKKFFCVLCSSGFENKSDLNFHFISFHHLEKNFLCVECFETFQNQNGLNEHLNIGIHVRKNNFPVEENHIQLLMNIANKKTWKTQKTFTTNL